jgi:hypothetical protein
MVLNSEGIEVLRFMIQKSFELSYEEQFSGAIRHISRRLNINIPFG